MGMFPSLVKIYVSTEVRISNATSTYQVAYTPGRRPRVTTNQVLLAVDGISSYRARTSSGVGIWSWSRGPALVDATVTGVGAVTAVLTGTGESGLIATGVGVGVGVGAIDCVAEEASSAEEATGGTARAGSVTCVAHKATEPDVANMGTSVAGKGWDAGIWFCGTVK